jgi:hypothetical protein
MPNSVKLFLAVIFGSFWLIPISVSVPFIYHNRHFLSLIIGYFLLAIWFSSYVIYEYNIDKNAIEKMRKNKFIIYILLFLFPLFIGDMLGFLAPITSDLLASKFAIHEYKAVKVEPYAKTFRQLSKLYVVDVKNNEDSFVIRNEMLNQLNLHSGDKLVVRGRNCIAGFVIDNINGIER